MVVIGSSFVAKGQCVACDQLEELYKLEGGGGHALTGVNSAQMRIQKC